MGKDNFFSKVKSFIFKDETSGLSEEQKKQLDVALQDRKFELIAQKRFMDLENKYKPKSKRSFSDGLSELKKYREANLRKHNERTQHLKTRRDLHERKVAMNKERMYKVKTGQLKTSDIVRKRLRGEKI